MTKEEFQQLFTSLQKAYGVQLYQGQIRSFYEQLRMFDARDLAQACQRIPANELKGFPKADIIKSYILDAKAEREFHQKQQDAQTYTRMLSNPPPSGNPFTDAFAKLCAWMIQKGSRHPDRVNRITQFMQEHEASLNLPGNYDCLSFLHDELERLAVTPIRPWSGKKGGKGFKPTRLSTVTS